MRKNILIVDDEPVQVFLLERLINSMDHNVIVMSDGESMVDFFANRKSINGVFAHSLDVVLLDLYMTGINGIEVLRQINHIKANVQVIVLTAESDTSLIIKALELGAFDYIVKGGRDIFTRIASSVDNAIERRALKNQISTLERRDHNQLLFSDIVGISPELIKAINLAKKIINSIIPVLIEGQNGTGKELLARVTHGSSSKSGKPFIVVECKFLKPSIIEVLLFGYEKVLSNGDFEKEIGKIREANGGTILLKNIDVLKENAQAKLLHFLQEGMVEPVGSKNTYKAAVRVIASTTQNLADLVKKGSFRQDLYYILNMFTITLPSLKERGQADIKLLAESFCHNFSISENKEIKHISPDALELLIAYDWADNVRQLKNYIFKAVLLSDGEVLKPEHFPQIEIRKQDKRSARLRIKNIHISDENSEFIDIFESDGNCKSLEQIEKSIIMKLVELYNGNLSQVSKILDIGRSTIYRKLYIQEKKQKPDEQIKIN